MARHAKSGGRIAAVTQWAAAALAAILVFGIGCVAGYQAKDSLGQAPFWIVFGGNTDPGDGNGNGAFKDQLVAGGWAGPDQIYQVHWAADIGGGGQNQVNEAMAAGHDAYARFCGGGCNVAGFSWGTAPALQLAAEVGLPPAQNYIFGGPQPAPGIWHAQFEDNPFVEPAIAEFGPFNPDRFVPAGTQVYFDSGDPYANMAPQCQSPYTSFDLAHHRVPGAGEPFLVWTAPDGSIIHEVGFTDGVIPFVGPISGSYPSPWWAGCIGNDWRVTANSPGAGTNEGVEPPPGFPAVPGFPSVPTEVPSFPGAPAFPGLPAPPG